MGGRSAPAPCSQSNQLIKQTPKALTHDFPSSLVLSLPLKNRYPRGFSVYPAASRPAVFALSGLAVYVAASQSVRFSLGPAIDD